MDKTLTCRDCGQSFLFSEEEQRFFEEKRFDPPTRCKPCRQLKKARREQNGTR
jgi:hypothetical protein